MKIRSPEFENNGPIPLKYTCQGEDVNPPLLIDDIPEGAASLALIMDDPDAPAGTWVHWVVYDIAPGRIVRIEEDSVPGTQGPNTSRESSYSGPCPPFGTHRYFFKVFALDRLLGAKKEMDKRKLEDAMKGHVLAEAQLIGVYKKK